MSNEFIIFLIFYIVHALLCMCIAVGCWVSEDFAYKLRVWGKEDFNTLCIMTLVPVINIAIITCFLVMGLWWTLKPVYLTVKKVFKVNIKYPDHLQ